jgi:hypothetical protein
LTPHFASPHSSPPSYSKFSVADETSATCCGEMYRAVASGGGEPNSPVILRLFLPYDFVNDYVKLGIAMINMRKEKSKLRPSYNNLSGGCGLVQQVVKCSIYYNNLSCGCGLV